MLNHQTINYIYYKFEYLGWGGWLRSTPHILIKKSKTAEEPKKVYLEKFVEGTVG